MSVIRTIMALTLVFSSFFSVQAFATENDTAKSTAAETSATAAKVNINTATAEQLDQLKGIGAAKAKDIVDYRTAHGSFKSVNDLANVKGFSSKMVEKLIAQNPGKIVAE